MAVVSAYGCMPVGSGLWEEQHRKHAGDDGTACAVCELFDDSLAVDDTANADMINFQTRVAVPSPDGEPRTVTLISDNGRGLADVSELAMLFKSKEGLLGAQQSSVSGFYGYGAKFAIMVTAKSSAVLYSRSRGADHNSLKEQLLLLSCQSGVGGEQDVIQRAILDLTGIPKEEAGIVPWLAGLKKKAMQGCRGAEARNGEVLQAMQALGSLEGFRSSDLSEVAGVANLYKFLLQQFSRCQPGRAPNAGTGTLWVLLDPSDTLQQWADKASHELADIILPRYLFGMAQLLPQDLELRPGRPYRDVARTPELVMGKCQLTPRELEHKGLHQQLRKYRSAVVPLLMADAPQGGPAAAAAAAASPFAYMLLTVDHREESMWRMLNWQGVPAVTAVHYVRAMEAELLLHTNQGQEASKFQRTLGNILSLDGSMASAFGQLGLPRGTLIDIGEGRSLTLTIEELRNRVLCKPRVDSVRARTPGAPMLLGAGLRVVLFLPPGNGVLGPTKTKSKVKLLRGDLSWRLEKMIRVQLLKLVLMYPPPLIFEQHKKEQLAAAEQAMQLQAAAEQLLSTAAPNGRAAAAAQLARAEAQQVVNLADQLAREYKQGLAYDQTPMTLGRVEVIRQQALEALQRAAQFQEQAAALAQGGASGSAATTTAAGAASGGGDGAGGSAAAAAAANGAAVLGGAAGDTYAAAAAGAAADGAAAGGDDDGLSGSDAPNGGTAAAAPGMTDPGAGVAAGVGADGENAAVSPSGAGGRAVPAITAAGASAAGGSAAATAAGMPEADTATTATALRGNIRLTAQPAARGQSTAGPSTQTKRRQQQGLPPPRTPAKPTARKRTAVTSSARAGSSSTPKRPRRNRQANRHYGPASGFASSDESSGKEQPPLPFGLSGAAAEGRHQQQPRAGPSRQQLPKHQPLTGPSRQQQQQQQQLDTGAAATPAAGAGPRSQPRKQQMLRKRVTQHLQDLTAALGQLAQTSDPAAAAAGVLLTAMQPAGQTLLDQLQG